MHIVVAGATGATGHLVVEQAIQAGHEVTALVRDAARFSGPETVRVVEADVVSGRGVDLPPGADVVISALGKRSAKDRAPVCESGVGHLLAAMKQAGLSRIVVISAAPVLRSGEGEGRFSRWVLGPVVRLWGRHIYPDIARMEEVLQGAGDWCAWTIIRPGYLTNATEVGRYRLVAEANDPANTRRPDLAAGLLAVAGDPSTAGHAFGIGSR